MARPNWANRTLCHGDNLEFLRSMNSESVHLIATDPPFNKGRDFHATPDSLAKGASFQDRWSWDRDVHESWIDKITDDFPDVMNVIQGSRNSYGDDMGAFLCFMGVRLLEMRRVLKNTGSIYLHCDPTASHYLKELMDAVFDVKNFRNEIIWCYSIGGRSNKTFGKKHDTILMYSKSDKYTFNADDPKVRIPRKPDSHMKILTDKKGDQWQEKTDKKSGKKYRYPLDKVANDYWIDIEQLNREDSERMGYPTQKPLTLYERIIAASSNTGDLVLDPFCGCATTCVAAEKLGRQWIGIDIWDKAHKTVIDRLKKEGFLAGPKDRRQDLIATEGKITYTKKLLKRTDSGLEAVPFLETKMKTWDEPKGEKMSRKDMVDKLLERHGCACQGCDRIFHDPRYLELDHNTPRADGGINHISNRVLLCSPCNKMKKHYYTLSWLRKENKKLGHMSQEVVVG